MCDQCHPELSPRRHERKKAPRQLRGFFLSPPDRGRERASDCRGRALFSDTGNSTYRQFSRCRVLTIRPAIARIDPTTATLEFNIDGDHCTTTCDGNNRLVCKYLYGAGVDQPLRPRSERAPFDVAQGGL
jgi:hypothetical protein